ncbi:MAG: hypothetical protein Q8L23_14180 [Caulobacter sp.]|nr:hypothetical protein [Caulobacter sp.]
MRNPARAHERDDVVEAPPAPPALRPGAVSAFAVFALVLGMLFPLLGLSILAAFAIDRLAPAALKLKYDP